MLENIGATFEFNRLDDMLNRFDELVLTVKRDASRDTWIISAYAQGRSSALNVDDPPLGDHLAWAIERLPEAQP